MSDARDDNVSRPAIVVLGATGGIGRASLVALARTGNPVVAVGRDAAGLRDVMAPLKDEGCDVAAFVLDLADARHGRDVLSYCLTRFGAVGAIVNAAAIYEPSSQVDMEAWERVTNTNLRGPLFVTSTFAEHLAAHGGGRIVHVTSTAAAVSSGGHAYYEASKAGLTAAARSMAIDYATAGVVVNCVAPGWIRTPMSEEFLAGCSPRRLSEVIPVGRVGESEEIADVISWLILAAPAFLTGQTITVDGGQFAHSAQL